MKNLTVFCFLSLVFLSGFQVSLAQTAPFSRGVNLSNWFQTGSATEIQLYQYSPQDFDQIKSLGCDVIRLPVNLIAMTGGAPNYSLDPLFFSFMDSVITWAAQSDMHLILDNHTFDPSVNTSPDIEDFLVKVWPQIAYRYKGRYDKLYYEILNEPHGISDNVWNTIQKKVIDKIRLVDQESYLVIGPADWNSYHNLDQMAVYDDPRLIYTFHFYDPFIFTHQGATWGDPNMGSLANVPFPYDPSSMPALPANLVGTWVESNYNNYEVEGTIAHVQELLDIAVAFKNQRNVPLFCGEFGVLHDNVNIESQRNTWYGTVREYLEANDIAWTTWDYHGGFGLFEKNSEGLFDHDLNLDLLAALGLNLPDQSEYQAYPDSSGILIYGDYIGKGLHSSNNSSGAISLYADTDPATGAFSIRWEDPNQYNHIGFDFRPNRDLSVLVAHGYTLDLWIRGNKPGTRLDLRFVDSKENDGMDRPWRIRFTIDESSVDWNGSWQKLSIPLSEFEEHGSWDDNQWFEPIGAFDWTAIDRFEMVDEYGIPHPVTLEFDQIELSGNPINKISAIDQKDWAIYPVPARDELRISGEIDGAVSYAIYALNGNRVLEGSISKPNTIDISSLMSGLYIIELFNKTSKFKYKRILKM
jgi:endoglucanase